jgi:hypothetical protein
MQSYSHAMCWVACERIQWQVWNPQRTCNHSQSWQWRQWWHSDDSGGSGDNRDRGEWWKWWQTVVTVWQCDSGDSDCGALEWWQRWRCRWQWWGSDNSASGGSVVVVTGVTVVTMACASLFLARHSLVIHCHFERIFFDLTNKFSFQFFWGQGWPTKPFGEMELHYLSIFLFQVT